MTILWQFHPKANGFGKFGLTLNLRAFEFVFWKICTVEDPEFNELIIQHV